MQFHPEVVHTPKGGQLLANFLEICGVTRDWTAEHIIDELIADVRTQVGDGRVLLAISGGVDSSTLGLLLARAVGEKLTAVFIDHGLLRLGEREQVEAALKPLGVNLVTVDARAEFMAALDGVSDPEQKRKIIGREFVEVFQAEAKKLTNAKWLAQGTIYPDVIESAGKGKKGQTIKSHHNVGGLPETLNLQLLEPLRELFKDEVRKLGVALGLPHDMVYRHPFPGQGVDVPRGVPDQQHPPGHPAPGPVQQRPRAGPPGIATHGSRRPAPVARRARSPSAPTGISIPT